MPVLLFLVHGMGVHGDDWATPVTAKLDEVARRYEHFKTGAPLSERITIHPISYDHVFEEQLARWSAAADELRSFLQVEGISLGQGADVLGWLSSAGSHEKHFFWSHMVDVLLYRYVDAVTKQVRLHVMTEMAEALRDAMTGGQITEASVLAHSLGTSVTHDALALLGTLPLGGSVAFTAGAGFRFTNLFTLANVSRVLETDPGVFTSVVHPGTQEQPEGYVRRYVDFRHAFDPIPAVRSFGPVGWGSRFQAVAGFDHLREFNVHGYEHYLDNPRVHIPILKALFGRRISADEEEEAIAGYVPVAGLDCPTEIDRFRTSVRQLIALVKDTGDPKRLVIAGAQFLALAKEVRDACV